jgi:hypothetical protein
MHVRIITITDFECLNNITRYTKPYQDSPSYNGTKRVSNINKRKKSSPVRLSGIFIQNTQQFHSPFRLTYSRANTERSMVETKLVHLCSTRRITYDYPQTNISYSLETPWHRLVPHTEWKLRGNVNYSATSSCGDVHVQPAILCD